ncbi:MAG: cytochrome C [Thermodesulfovibrionales bacterium]
MKAALIVILAALAASASSTAQAAEARYTTDIKPLFQRRCSACHGPDSPEYGDFKADKARFTAVSRGPRMDTYAHLIFFVGWPDTGALMRRLDDGASAPGGKPGNMYVHLGDSEEERRENLRVFKAWVGNWTLKRWRDVTREEMGLIKVPY